MSRATGKHFFVDYLCALYRNFVAREENRRYAFNIRNLDALGNWGKIRAIQSQTFEDPMILAMNLYDSVEKNRQFLSESAGFSEEKIDRLYDNFRPLGACSEYIVNEIRDYANGDPKKASWLF